MKAIFIDSDNQKLIPIELDKQKDLLEQYYSIIGNNCKCIDAPYQFNDNEILLVDDEGLFNTAKRGFKYPDWNYPVVGNGIITGVNNDTGDFVSLTSDIEKFNNIIWCDEKEINIHVSKTLGDYLNEADLNVLQKLANYELIQIVNLLKNHNQEKDSLAVTTISKYFGIPSEKLEDYHFLAFQYALSNELAKRLEDCMSSF
jgi:hypothetical protein